MPLNKKRKDYRTNQLAWKREWRRRNPSLYKEQTRASYLRRRERILTKAKEFYLLNREALIKKITAYYSKNKAARAIYNRNHHIKNKTKNNLRSLEYIKTRSAVDCVFKFRCRVRALIATYLSRRCKEKRRATGGLRFLPYATKDLIKHIERQFKDGMSWDNYGFYWHLDHKTPDSWFTYSCVEDVGFKKAWALENLQPMLALENLKKNNKYASS